MHVNEINSFHKNQIQNMKVKEEKRKIVNNKETTTFWNTEILLSRQGGKVDYQQAGKGWACSKAVLTYVFKGVYSQPGADDLIKNKTW